MTDYDDHAAQQLGTLLHERVRDVHPDLAARASAGVRIGTRLRRRTRLTCAATMLGGAAVVLALGPQVWPTTTSTTLPGGSSVAASGSPSPTSPSDCRHTPGYPRTSVNGGSVAPMTGHQAAQSCLAPIGPAPTAGAQHLPVSLAAPGWTCDTPGDDKFACGNGASEVAVTLRPAALHGAYLSDPDKASPDQFVSSVHGDAFATIERVHGDVSVDQLADYLVWE